MGVDFTVSLGWGIVIPDGVEEKFAEKIGEAMEDGLVEYLYNTPIPGAGFVELGSYYDDGESNVKILTVPGRVQEFDAYDAPGGLWSTPNARAEPTEEQIKAVKSAAKALGIKKEDRKVVPFIGGLWH